MAHGGRGGSPDLADDWRRVAAFRRLLDRSFVERRDVAFYARQLGCGEKALARATLAVEGLRPKALVVARVTLEAKRLLVHTGLPVQDVSDALGFDETSNFVKFFKREAGCTPAVFRRRYAAT